MKHPGIDESPYAAAGRKEQLLSTFDSSQNRRASPVKRVTARSKRTPMDSNLRKSQQELKVSAFDEPSLFNIPAQRYNRGALEEEFEGEREFRQVN